MNLSVCRLFASLPLERRLQKGVSLVELMIGVALGLLMVAVLLKVTYVASFSSAFSHDLHRMQESGNSALDFMGFIIRQAGARSGTDYSSYGLNYVNSIAGTNGSAGVADTLTVKYEAAGGEIDFLGAAVVKGQPLTYTFTVDMNTRQLFCNDGNANVVVAENIEDLQIQYGVDGNKDGVVDSLYINAPTAAEFDRVLVVNVSLVVRASTPKSAANDSQTILINGVSQTKTDGFLRQVFSSSFMVRNRVQAADYSSWW